MYLYEKVSQMMIKKLIPLLNRSETELKRCVQLYRYFITIVSSNSTVLAEEDVNDSLLWYDHAIDQFRQHIIQLNRIRHCIHTALCSSMSIDILKESISHDLRSIGVFVKSVLPQLHPTTALADHMDVLHHAFQQLLFYSENPKNIQVVDVCTHCGNFLFLLQDTMFYVCEHCFTEYREQNVTFAYTDLTRVSSTARCRDRRPRLSIRHVMRHIQGANSHTIPNSVIQKVRQYLVQQGIIEMDETHIAFVGLLNKDILVDICQKLELSQYKDVVYELFMYCLRTPFPNMQHVEQRIFNDFGAVFDTYPEIGKASIVQLEALLIILALRLRFPLDIHILTFFLTTKPVQRVDACYQNIFVKLGWEWPSVMRSLFT